jgi:hypothetical protein
VKIVAALLAAAVVLIAVELGMGAWSFGGTKSENACTTTSSYAGGGIDGVLQRIVIDGLYGAACELHTTREELVLSLTPSRTRAVKWDPETIQRAVRAGLLRAIDRAEARGELPGFVASVLRAVARRAPVKLLVEGGSGVSDLIRTLLG